MAWLQEILLDPLQFAFMQRALFAVIIIGIISGVMGTYVVTRGMAFLGDALAHSVLPGVAIAFINGNNSAGGLLAGGMIAGILAAISIGIITRGRRIAEDTAIGIIFAGTLALGIGIISSSRSFATDLQHILIGNILGVSQDDIVLMAIMSLIVLIIIFSLYKEMLVISFDPTLAQTMRLPAETLRIILLVLLAVTIVIGVQAVGITLIAATLVTPAATARLLTHRLHIMMILSAMIASLSGIGGMYLAWHLNVAPSAAIVLLMTAIFLIAYLLAPHRGVLWTVWGYRAKK
jgi:manganese/iron transport system permease protein